MYCEHLLTATGEWIPVPPALNQLLHDPCLVQLTHGVCPICYAGQDEPPQAEP